MGCSCSQMYSVSGRRRPFLKAEPGADGSQSFSEARLARSELETSKWKTPQLPPLCDDRGRLARIRLRKLSALCWRPRSLWCRDERYRRGNAYSSRDRTSSRTTTRWLRKNPSVGPLKSSFSLLWTRFFIVRFNRECKYTIRIWWSYQRQF